MKIYIYLYIRYIQRFLRYIIEYRANDIFANHRQVNYVII